MRDMDEVQADAEPDHRAFSNGTQFDMWADRWCYRCVNDDFETERYCPILGVALLGSWPKEWLRERVQWTVGDASGWYETVGSCTEFEERREPGPGEEAPPDPGPPPVVPGQIDMFEVFVERGLDALQDKGVGSPAIR